MSPATLPPARLALALLAAAVAAPGQAPVPPAQIDALLQRLDRAFAAGDLAGYLAAFRPDQPDLHLVMERRLRALLAEGPWRRVSRRAPELQRVGDHTVALVRSELRRTAAPPDAAPTDPPLLQESWFLVLRPGTDAPVATMAVEVHEEMLHGHVEAGRFACPPCNYQAGADGWLAVPLRPERALTMEAVSFYLLGSDIACDVSVHVDAEPMDAARAAQDLAARIAGMMAGTRVSAPTPWLPPSLGGRAPAGFTGARVTADLPDASRCVIHVDALGPLRHVLLLRGSRASLAHRAADVDRLLASYRILELDVAAAELVSRPLRAHTGGGLQGDAYVNPRHAIACHGPQGWSAALLAGGFLFRVVWTCPERRGRMWLTGHGPPVALRAWTRDQARAFLQDLCTAAGLRTERESAWQAPPEEHDFWTLTAHLRPADQPAAGAPQRLVRLCLRDDLLLVMDGYVTGTDDLALLQAAYGSLRCR